MAQKNESAQTTDVVRPLQGVRVLDLTHILAGPYCTMMLGDAGAEVIKIERPGKGETARQGGPWVTTKDGEKMALNCLRLLRNKKSVALDLQKPRGQEVFKELVKVSDVVVENFSPGTMKKLGLDYDVLREVNPRIIYATISGFGKLERLRGPYWKRPANNPSVQAMGGIMDITGDPDGPPTLVGVQIGDIVPGMFTCQGILMALLARQLTGRGQQVDVAMYDSMVAMGEQGIPTFQMTGAIMDRRGAGRAAPYGCFKTKNGYASVAGLRNQERWAAMWRVAGREDMLTHPELVDPNTRASKWHSVIRPALEEWAKDKTKEEVTDIFLSVELSVGPVQNAKELYECPHLRARNMVITAEDPRLGPVSFAGSPIKLSDTPDLEPTVDSRVGAYTDEVLTSLLRYSKEKIEELRAAGVL